MKHSFPDSDIEKRLKKAMGGIGKTVHRLGNTPDVKKPVVDKKKKVASKMKRGMHYDMSHTWRGDPDKEREHYEAASE